MWRLLGLCEGRGVERKMMLGLILLQMEGDMVTVRKSDERLIDLCIVLIDVIFHS